MLRRHKMKQPSVGTEDPLAIRDTRERLLDLLPGDDVEKQVDTDRQQPPGSGEQPSELRHDQADQQQRQQA